MILYAKINTVNTKYIKMLDLISVEDSNKDKGSLDIHKSPLSKKKVFDSCSGRQPVKTFKLYCKENPSAAECRIYDV